MKNNEGYFEGKLLIATPQLDETDFGRSVIYVCAHNPKGAMGLIINHVLPGVGCGDILDQLGVDSTIMVNDLPVHLGGPVESGKGFILHSNDYKRNETICINNQVSITSDIKVLKDIISGDGPAQSLFTLGYAGWGAGQLEEEIKKNQWMLIQATDELLFVTPDSVKWNKAIETLGINSAFFSSGNIMGNA